MVFDVSLRYTRSRLPFAGKSLGIFNHSSLQEVEMAQMQSTKISDKVVITLQNKQGILMSQS